MAKEINIESYFQKDKLHAELLRKLRAVLLEYPFEETIKWGMPTYMMDKKNLLGLGAFKNHVALWFFQGALLRDEEKILRNAQEGKTKVMRQIHYKNSLEIRESLLKKYIEETLENHDKGLVIKIERKPTHKVIPEELKTELDQDKRLAEKFADLSPGKQREYAEYIGSAKREKTKTDRLAKIIPMIEAGKGLYDKYKNC